MRSQMSTDLMDKIHSLRFLVSVDMCVCVGVWVVASGVKKNTMCAHRTLTTLPAPRMSTISLKSKKSSGKASARAYLLSKFPQIEIPKTSAPNGVTCACDVVCEDSLQILRCFDYFSGIKYSEMIYGLLRWAQYYLANTDCKVYVMCYDKSKYVIKSKSDEQKVRSEGALKRADPASVEVNMDEIGDGNTKTDENFSWKISQRDTYRPALLRWICTSILYDPSYSFVIPKGKQLMISGHCIEEVYDYVACIDSDHNVSFEYENKQGEAELQFLYLSNCMDWAKSFEMVSTDTDVLFLSLMFLDARPGITVQWKFAQTNGWICSRYTYPKLSEDRRISINMLSEAIQREFSLSCGGKRLLKTPIQDVILVYLIAGSDCSKGYWGVTHERMFSVYFDECLGDLYKSDRMDGNVYCKLILKACEKKRKKSNCDNPAAGTATIISVTFKALHVVHYFRVWKRWNEQAPEIDDMTLYGYNGDMEHLYE